MSDQARPAAPLGRGAGSGVDAVHAEPRWEAPPWNGSPPEEAYTRVTDAERYRPLHDFALALVDDLVAEFDVEIVREPALPSGLGGGVVVERAILLRPAADGAPIIVGLTAFPGLEFRFGESARVVFPSCGCDACDEHVEDLVESIREHVEAVVSGGFAEGADEWWSFRTERWASWTGDARRPVRRHDWPAWPRRAVG